MGRSDVPVDTNEVTLTGRVAGVREHVMPSGDVWVVFRVIVRRGSASESGRTEVDTIDCVARTSALRRRVLDMSEGHDIEVSGALRRRFWRSAGGPASRTEVEVRALKRAS